MMSFLETRCRISCLALVLVSLMLAASVMVQSAWADETEPRRNGNEKADPASIEFFEKDVRPILANRCQGCHGPAKQKGGLRLDARSSILSGGTSGPAVVPGDPKESLLVNAINYGETNQMPPKSKLPDAEIATLTRWVQMGAPWGFESATVAKAAPEARKPDGRKTAAGESDWQSEFRARSQFWSFQPLRRVTPPTAKGLRSSARNEVDQFILSGLGEHGLRPAPEAGRRTLIRRLSYDLTGLPPSAEETASFLADPSADAYERLVDRLLASPRYGERWARHWLDLVRYAETAGHEFDYDILNATRYRDYVIRALNADLPYDQFVTEQLAGDLLTHPRRHPVEGFNESIIGTGFYYLGEGTHSPVNVREEEVRRVDNQIDVISKAFLGLTVACARCHDHKFDPIGNRDYYALAGFLRSSRYQQAFIDPPGLIERPIGRLEALKAKIVALLAEVKSSLPDDLRRQAVDVLSANSLASNSRAAGKSETLNETVFEDFDRDSYDGWYVTGQAFGDRPTRSCDLRLDLTDANAKIARLSSGVAHSGVVSPRLRGVLRSRTFTLENRYIHYRVAGRGGVLNVVVDGFEKIRDPIYGGLTTTVNIGDQPRWITQDVGMWLGQTAYLEIADGALADFQGGNTRLHDESGYVAVDEIRMSNLPAPSASPVPAEGRSLDIDQVISILKTANDPRADRLKAAVDEARDCDSRIPQPNLCLAIADGTGVDERILIRGNHKNPGEIVPRRFLEVLGGAGRSTPEAGSGRLEFARRVVDPKNNPLTPRVLVNRLWKHHFGEGLVKSTDDFGAMGRKPSHPELLDWLASEFVRRGWSIKAIHRLIVTSSTYRMSSVPDAEAEHIDPENLYLHRMNVRRLEAEAIRDGLMRASGRLVNTMYGPSVPTHLTGFMEGRGRPGHSGPLDGDGRRSIYLGVRRNFINPMFLAFDTPVPFSTMGRRNVSNVPAQALTLMNDPVIVQQARLWAERVAQAPGRTDRQCLDELFASAFGRPPTADEVVACLGFLGSKTPGDSDAASHAPKTAVKRDLTAWADLCHVLINMKEFIFVD